MSILLLPNPYAAFFAFTLTQMGISKKPCQASANKSDAVCSAILSSASTPPSASPSRNTALVSAAPPSEADKTFPVIVDKIQSVLKTVDSTLDPATKFGFALGIALLICACIPGIGHIFLVIGIVVLFITFLLWLGKCAEDSATPQRP